jgi:hypothetical protein
MRTTRKKTSIAYWLRGHMEDVKGACRALFVLALDIQQLHFLEQTSPLARGLR